MSRGRSGGMGEWGCQPGVYVPLKALFLVLLKIFTFYSYKNLCILHGQVLVMTTTNIKNTKLDILIENSSQTS